MKNVSPRFVGLRTIMLLACAVIAQPIVHAAPGDLYSVDEIAGKIFRIKPDGTKATFVTGLGNVTFAIAFDPSGNLFAGDYKGIVKFTPDGTKSLFAPGVGAYGLAFDSFGNLFASFNNSILKIKPNGTSSVFALVDQPVGLAFDSQGNLFAAEYVTGKIFKFTPDGASRTQFADLYGYLPGSMAFDPQGNLFVSTGNFDLIAKITPDGTRTTFALQVSGIFGLAFNPQGDLFAANYYTVDKFAPDGTRTTFSAGYQIVSALAFEPVPRKLLNVSARGFVDTGDKVVIAGFIVGGNGVANNAVVIRAIGPSLPRAGSLDPLSDPTLELHNTSGAIIASNNNWEDTQREQIIAAGLAPTDPRESAIFATLPAGNYTAVVRGVSEGTGIALAEVYSLR